MLVTIITIVNTILSIVTMGHGTSIIVIKIGTAIRSGITITISIPTNIRDAASAEA